MGRRRLFLLGGDSAAFELIADEFVAAAGGPEAAIALLLIGGEGWERHRPAYLAPWQERGVECCSLIVPGAEGRLDVGAAVAELRRATGMVVGGGDTLRYQELYATEPIRRVTREQYQRGVPYAGLSAGAMLACEVCLKRPRRPEDPPLRILPGLGLVKGLVVGVHFSETKALPDLLEAMRRTRIGRGLGIDEGACVMLEDEEVRRVAGGSAYELRMEDFGSGRHVVKRIG